MQDAHNADCKDDARQIAGFISINKDTINQAVAYVGRHKYRGCLV